MPPLAITVSSVGQVLDGQGQLFLTALIIYGNHMHGTLWQQKCWSMPKHGHNSLESGVKYRPAEKADRSNSENRCVQGKPAEVWVCMLSRAITVNC